LFYTVHLRICWLKYFYRVNKNGGKAAVGFWGGAAASKSNLCSYIFLFLGLHFYIFYFFILFIFSFFIGENGRTHAYSLPALAFVLSLWQRVGVSALFCDFYHFLCILLIIVHLKIEQKV
jgi:hypothetical protein